jgi:hypothetical protein
MISENLEIKSLPNPNFLIRIGGGVGSNWVHSANRPPSDLMYLSRVNRRMENLVGWWYAKETEVLWEMLPQCHFVHYKSHMTWPGNPLAKSIIRKYIFRQATSFLHNSVRQIYYFEFLKSDVPSP